MPKKDIGYLIKVINDKLKAGADADLKCSGLTFTQSQVLNFLSSRGGTATQKEIEIFLEVSHPTVTGVVSRMEQNGYVACRIDDTNRRNKLVSLTDQARQIEADLDRQLAAKEKTILSSLSEEEIAELERMLLVIYKNLGG